MSSLQISWILVLFNKEKFPRFFHQIKGSQAKKKKSHDHADLGSIFSKPHENSNKMSFLKILFFYLLSTSINS